MNRCIAGLVLSVIAATASGDIWTSLFSEKLQEAADGSAEAQYDVGAMYQNGRGTTPDRARAIEWYRKAAAQGDARAVSRLKLMQANEERFSKTAEQAGQGDIESQYTLGNMYMKGVGTEIRRARAIETFRQAAGQGHVKAAYKLGMLYYEGSGTGSNHREAVRWFRQAADSGYPAAQFYLGKLYAAGHGVSRDYDKALAWLDRAVDGGFDQARGVMIDVSERMQMAAAANTRAPRPVAVKKKPVTGKKRIVNKAKTAVKKPGSPRYAPEDLMLASWSRDEEPVAWLPSTINTCRMEGDRMICFSDDQTRSVGGNVIKFKTKAIIENFSGKGAFEVTYRNLVISATRTQQKRSGDTTEIMGSIDDEPMQAYAVKTGWGNPHTLECAMNSTSEVSCTRHGVHAFLLTSPETLANK